MIYEEAIETIKIAKAEVEWNYPLAYQIAFDMAIEALSKQIPKKPKYESEIGREIGLRYCPNCGIRFIRWGFNFCSNCGQHIDWRDEEDD